MPAIREAIGAAMTVHMRIDGVVMVGSAGEGAARIERCNPTDGAEGASAEGSRRQNGNNLASDARRLFRFRQNVAEGSDAR